MNKLQLIALYYRGGGPICECYDTQLRWCCQRHSHNSLEPEFTDKELLTIYIYVMLFEEKHKINSIWRHASAYLRSWFPALPSYERFPAGTFNARLNRLSDVFPGLTEYFLSKVGRETSEEISLMDSLPIMLCSAKRKANPARRAVACDIFDKGYCSTKGTHCYGLKLHITAKHAPNALPVPEFVGLTPASTHDLTAVRSILPKLARKALFGDKIYADQPLNKKLQGQQDTFIYTPVKLVKGQSEQERQRNKAADDLFSKAVSTVRQPIESLFNWFIEKTNMQNASKIRSRAGLYIHVFGKLAAASFLMFINS